MDAANRTLGNVEKTTAEMNAKMDLMMKMFQQLVLPEQKEMAKLVEQKGGAKACLDNDKLLRELSDAEGQNGSQSNTVARGGKGSAKPTDIEDLQSDLHTDPDDAMEKNMLVFNRKFEVQKRQIV